MIDKTAPVVVQAWGWGLDNICANNSQVFIHKKADSVLFFLACSVYNLCCLAIIPSIGIFFHGFKAAQTFLQGNTDHTWKHLLSFAIDAGCALFTPLIIHCTVIKNIFNLVVLLATAATVSLGAAALPMLKA